MKIAFLYSFDWELPYFQDSLKHHDVLYIKGLLAQNMQQIPDDIDVLCTWLDSAINSSVFTHFKKLKLVVTRSVGFDHIDLTAAKKAGVTVCYAPHYAGPAVAEFTIGLMLALARKLLLTHERVCSSDFSRNDLCGFELAGKTLGVVGTGDIGARVVQLAHAFGMKVLAYDVCPQKSLTKAYACSYISLPELCAQSDIISLHVPYNKDTYHLINCDTLATCKRGIYLINTARGEIVETEALVQGLKAGIFAGLALDVFEYGLAEQQATLRLCEALDTQRCKVALANQYLIHHPHVLVSPHNAFNTQQAFERLVVSTLNTIDQFAAGTPINIVPE